MKRITIILLFICLNSKTIGIEKFVNYYGPYETLNKIYELISNHKPGAYIRFGDGDLNIGLNHKKAGKQQYDSALSLEIREALCFKGENILKCLPWGSESSKINFWNRIPKDKIIINHLNKIKELGNFEFEEVYSPIALTFSALDNPAYCIKFLKLFKKNKCIIVANDNIQRKTLDLIFNNAEIITSQNINTYSTIDKMEQDCKNILYSNQNNYNILVTCAGPAGRALQKRLLKSNLVKNTFLFDFGSLIDALSDLETRQWIKINKLDSSQFLDMLNKE